MTMLFIPPSWFAAGDFIWSNSAARNTLICCVFLVVLTCIPWLRWISHVQHRPDDANDNVESGKRGEDKILVSEDRDSNLNPSDQKSPPQAEYGLHILHECREADVDIVAVHGLAATPTYAWVWLPKNNPPDKPGYPDKPFNWLTELLPTKLELSKLSCQVMAFNYDSNWFFNAPQQRLSNISDSLIDSLRNQRNESNASGRPIIFVGHSFGGNIIEQAIVSASRHRSEYLCIPESTVGIVFLGTPHRGSKAATWGRLITSLAPPGFVTEDRLLKALEEQSDSLTDRLHDFSSWLFSESVPAVCGFEQLPTDYSSRVGVIANIIPHTKELVVPEPSACIDGQHKISLHTDHFKINKFYGSDDPSFKLVYPEIERMTHHAEETLRHRRNPKEIPIDQGTTSGNLRKCLQKMRVNNPVDVLLDVKTQKGERVGNTCEWILRQEEFSTWGASEYPQFLRLIGSPGIGKTMMSTFLVEVLKAKVERSSGKVFAYFFCDDKHQDRKTPTAILRSLVWQLLLQRNELFHHIQLDFEKHEDNHVFEGLFDNFSALWRIFQNMLQDERAGEVFVLVDALDECEKPIREVLLHSISNLFRSPPVLGKFKFLVTCRPEIDDIEYELRQVGVSLRMDLGNINNDLSEYIENRVDDLASRNQYSLGLKRAVSDTLHEQAGGTFLWVSLMLEVLRKTPKDEVKKKLNNLPRGLDETYARILNENNSEDKQKRARFLLLSMVAARRPLKKIEIAAAFALWKDGLVLQQQELYDYTDICSSCSSIVYLNAAKNDYNTTVTFCHQSVKDFLLNGHLSSNGVWYHTSLDKADLLMFQVCWGYLSSDIFDNGRLVIWHKNGVLHEPYSMDLQPHFKEHALLSYAFKEWRTHALGSYPALLCELSKINLIKAPTLRDTWLLRAAQEGQEAVVALLLEKGAELESRDEYGWTPLSWAARGGHEAVVVLLLEKGAELESRDISGRTPLSWAAEGGHEAVVVLLLEKGAELKSRDEDGWTPLSRAAAGGHETVVVLLLEKGAELESRDEYGWTPLSRAAAGGHEAVVVLLLEKGAELESRDEYGWTPLSWAAEGGHEAVVVLLLEKGAELESRDEDGWTPLSQAAAGGHETVVVLLLEKGAELESRDEDGWTPLSRAAAGGHEAVVVLLLEKGAELESRDEYGWTPLSWAAEGGHEAVVVLLLEKGAELESRDEDGWTPLSQAAAGGHETVVVLLLEKGAELESRDEDGWTPLSRAAAGGHEAVVVLLLEKGAELESRDISGRTPLSRAAERGHEAVVKLLTPMP